MARATPKGFEKRGRKTYAFSSKELTVQAVAPITEEQGKFLRELSLRCREEQGKYIDRSQLLRSLVRALEKLEDQVDWKGITSEDVLLQRLIDAFKRSRK